MEIFPHESCQVKTTMIANISVIEFLDALLASLGVIFSANQQASRRSSLAHCSSQ